MFIIMIHIKVYYTFQFLQYSQIRTLYLKAQSRLSSHNATTYCHHEEANLDG